MNNKDLSIEEKDLRMEKCLKCQFVYTGYCNGTCILKNNEQKTTDKVEPKFKIGDYVVGKYISGYISEVRDDCYLLDYQGFPIDKQDDYHLWTIQDAKDGDVLVGGEQLFLFKRMNTSNSFYAHCNYHFIGYDSLSVYDCSYSIDNIYPATKKQRDLLFQKMEDASYEWDAYKKELKKIGQKPFWSEEDETMVTNIIIMLKKVQVFTLIKKIFRKVLIGSKLSNRRTNVKTY